MMQQSKKQPIVLIVEDEASLLSALVIKLEREGLTVMKAKNGEEGLEVALKAHPDLILLDIVMPRMDGITMFKKLREDAWGKNVKVIILTNLSDKETLVRDIEHDSYDYLIKSDWKIENVVARVKEKLRPL